jgi:hypothetical protein
MSLKKVRIVLIVFIIFLLGTVSVAQAAPPLQEGDSSEDSTFGETLDLDDVDDDGGKNNLGSIMSDKDNTADTEEGVPEDGDPEDGDPEDGDPEDGDPEDGDPEDGDPEDGDPEDGDPEDGDPEDGDPEDGDPEDGGFKEHPVASALAEYFKDTPYFEGASYDEVYNEIMGLHEAGNGFGNITKACFFAEKLGFEDLGELLDAAHGSGWGNVLKEGGIHPGSVGNGGKNKPDNAGPPDKDKDKDNGPPGQNKKNGDSSELVGQGNGNGNNGNGNKGGNGQGNGNKGGNGKGNGKGGGKGNSK